MKFCLIVDDSEVIRKVAGAIVESLGLIAVEAETADKALEICESSMPDVILLDWDLPGMTAFDFLAALKLVGAASFPQILYCPTEADPKDIKQAVRAGCAGYVLKPYDRESLAPKVREVMRTVDAFKPELV
ncbi:MAG: response regulator [Alphaproteobacteria bacterium]|nr:response regulator [Alphaproteobacteria bacterium]